MGGPNAARRPGPGLRRAAAAALVLAGSAAALPLAARVRLDLGVEQLFPVHDPARAAYDRWRARFPAAEAGAAVIVAGPRVLTPDGVARLAALERALARVPGVDSTLSIASLETAVAGRAGPVRGPLLPPGLDAAEREARLAAAAADPLLAWTLLRPDRRAAFVLVELDPAAAATDAGRRAFLEGARAALADGAAPGEERVLTGIPPMRASLAELLRRDVSRLVPGALLLVLLVVLAAFRSAAAGVAGLLASATSLLWTAGALGALGFSLGLVLGLLPILVAIVSVGDTVHLAGAFERLRREGAPPWEAAAGAVAEAARACLLTEVVLACGFLSLALVNVRAIAQLGIATAVAMLVTWAATTLVAPLALGALARRGPAPARPPPALRALSRVVSACARVALRRPRRVVAATAAVVAAGAVLASRVEKVDFIYDDLRPGSPLERDVRAAESLFGGYVPVVVHLAAEGDDAPALDPACLRLADRAAAFLRSFPEVKAVASPADLVRAAHVRIAGPDAADDPGGLPETRDVAARELDLVRAPRLVASFVSADRRSVSVVARVPDVGTRRAGEIFDALDAWLARERAALAADPAAPRVRLDATGPLRLLVDVDRQLVGGLVASFGAALAVSLAVMALALRSLRLGIVALVPNALPTLLVPALMALAGIPLQAATVTVFSIALVVADDDTIQLLERVRARHAAVAGRLPARRAHVRALVGALREAGPPMLVGSLAVSLGFSLLLASSARSTAHVGFLLSGTLVVAVLADLFLTPLLVARLLPLAPRRGRRAA